MAFFLSKTKAKPSEKPYSEFASLEKRLYACAIDFLVIVFLLVLLHHIQLLLFVQCFYFPLCWWKFHGQTIGNKYMHIRVVTEAKMPLSFTTSVIRFVGFFLSEVTLIGFAWILFDKKRQGLHDKLAHTIVIHTL